VQFAEKRSLYGDIFGSLNYFISYPAGNSTEIKSKFILRALESHMVKLSMLAKVFKFTLLLHCKPLLYSLRLYIKFVRQQAKVLPEKVAFIAACRRDVAADSNTHL
jgi:hypothetical protein